jgi:hypothetical protein
MTPSPTATTSRGKPRRGVLGVLRAAGLAVLPLLVLLLLAEGVFWATGAGDPDDRRVVTGGFDDHASYLVPDPAVPGGWVTQMFSAEDGLSPEIHVPPRSDAIRVLMFGGSNTEGFPEDYIEEQLDAALPDPGFEIFNLGRHGYGSERVRILLTQAMVLQPDIVFIYLGHNEFVERGFAMELAQQWQQPWQAAAADRLLHLRTLNVLVSALESARAPATGAGQRPEGRGDRGQEFDDLLYEQTLVFFDVYRRNYEALLDTVADAGAEVLFSTVISNDFVPPCQMNYSPALTKQQVDGCIKLRGKAHGEIPPRFLPGLIQTRSDNAPIHLRPTDWAEAVPPEERAARRARARAQPSPVLRTLPPPLDQQPLWTAPDLWTDQVGVLLNTMAALHERKLSDDERASLRRAVDIFEESKTLVPDHPFTFFEQGLCVYLLGDDPPRAARLLHDAARYDRAPMRGNDITNGIVRELAAAHPDAAFVDAEDFMRGVCPDGLISYEVMMDNCHMHYRVLPHVMDRFIPKLVEQGKKVIAERGRGKRGR